MISRRPLLITFALLPALFVPLAGHGSTVSPARAWVLDSGAKALICLALPHGVTLTATLEVAANPRMVTRRGETVYVVGEEAVTLVDPVAPQVTATIPLRSDQRALVDDDDVPTELELSADGRRAFILYGLHNKMAVLDLQAKAAVGSTKTGRRNKKLLAGLARGLQAGGLYRWWVGAAGLAMDLTDGYSRTARVTPHMLAIRPDGRFAYALNSQARDVTVVDAVTAETAEQIGAGGQELRLLTGGDVLAVLSSSKIHLLDTAEHTKLDELDVPDLRTFESTPDGAYAVALGKGTVLCLNGSSGEVLARLTDLANPLALAFDSVADRSGPGDARVTPLGREAQQPGR